MAKRSNIALIDVPRTIIEWRLAVHFLLPANRGTTEALKLLCRSVLFYWRMAGRMHAYCGALVIMYIQNSSMYRQFSSIVLPLPPFRETTRTTCMYHVKECFPPLVRFDRETCHGI